MTARDALLIPLIENDITVRDHQVRGVIDSDFVGLQTIAAYARVDIPFTSSNQSILRTSRCLRVAIHGQRIPCLDRRQLTGCRTHRLVLLQRIDVRRVRDRIFDFAIDRIGCLRRGRCQ